MTPQFSRKEVVARLLQAGAQELENLAYFTDKEIYQLYLQLKNYESNINGGNAE